MFLFLTYCETFCKRSDFLLGYAKMYIILKVLCLGFLLKDTLSLKYDPNCTNFTKYSDPTHKSFECPPFEDKAIQIEFELNESLQIQCYNNSTNILDFDFQFDLIKSLKIQDCNMTTDLDQIFGKWNLNGIEKIEFRRIVLPDGLLSKNAFGNINKTTVKWLQVIHCGMKDIEEELLLGFNNLERLDFSDNELTSFTDFFKFLPKLQEVDFHGNKIETLSEVMTSPKLRWFRFSGNNLKTINSSIFFDTVNLERLDLSSNSLEHIPEDLLEPLKLLKHASFGLSPDIQYKLTQKFFKENVKLKDLRYRNGSIEISEDAFHNLSALENMSLYGCQIKTLSKGVFKNLTNLKYLNLGGNEIEYLPDGIFENSVNLKTLDLSHNQLREWKATYHNRGLVNLNELRLDYNKLQELPSRSFTNVRNLEKLILHHNQIKNIDVTAFDEQSSITYLDLSYNNLHDNEGYSFGGFIETFNYLLSLQTIILKNNFYTDVPNFNTGRNLKIDLENNNLTLLRSIFDLINYNTVNLKGNEIKYVDFQNLKLMVHLSNISDANLKIDLNNNPIICDCFSYDLVNFFQNLYDTRSEKNVQINADNLYCKHPPELAGVPIKKLTEDDLKCDVEVILEDYTCPENCSCSIYTVNSTLEINCSNLGLSEAPAVNTSVRNIHAGEIVTRVSNYAVNLMNNHISRFSKNIGYENVTKLSISNNELKDIQWLPPKLEILEINNNNLTSLNENILPFFENNSLTSLKLNNNPWKCDCSIARFSNIVRSKLLKLVNGNRIDCEDGQDLKHLTETELCKEDHVVITALYALLVVLLLTLAILMILYYKFEKVIKIWLFSNNLLLWFVTEEELDKEKEYDAFVSYSHKDEEFVEKDLVPELENGDNPYRLCIHVRDWIVGEFINRQITDSIQKSRRTIIVLSKNFLESSWAIMEFRTAHMQMMKEKRNRLIVILYNDIDPNQIEDEELKNYLNSNTYIKWGDRWFWKKLKYALPHREQEKRNKRMHNIMISIDDKIDLTAVPTTPNTQTPPAMSVDPLLLKVNPLQLKLAENKVSIPAGNGIVTTPIC